MYYIHAIENGQVKYYNQDVDGNIAFDRDSKVSLSNGLPYIGCEGVDVSEFYNGSNSLYEAYNFLAARGFSYNIDITNFEFEDVLISNINKEAISSVGSTVINNSRASVTKTLSFTTELSKDLTIGFDSTIASSTEQSHSWNVDVGISYSTSVTAGVEAGASFLGTGGKVTGEMSTTFGGSLDVGYSGSYITNNQQSVTI